MNQRPAHTAAVLGGRATTLLTRKFVAYRVKLFALGNRKLQQLTALFQLSAVDILPSDKRSKSPRASQRKGEAFSL